MLNVKNSIETQNQNKLKIENAINQNPTFSTYLVPNTDEYSVVKNQLEILFQKLDDIEPLQNDFLKMIENYSYYPVASYPTLFKKAYHDLCNFHNSESAVFWLPTEVPAPVEPANMADNLSLIGLVKSSEFMTYLSKGEFVKFIKKYQSEDTKATFLTPQFSTNTTRSNLLRKSTDKKTVLSIIDDFVGTGKQADKALLQYEQSGLEINSLLTLAITSKGYRFLKEKHPNLKIFFGCFVKEYDEINISRENFQQLLTHLNFVWEKQKDSGALVSMNRTPNNTVAFFRTHKDAPFPR